MHIADDVAVMISRIYLFFLIPGSGLANLVTPGDVITFLVTGSLLEAVLKSVLPSNCTAKLRRSKTPRAWFLY